MNRSSAIAVDHAESRKSPVISVRDLHIRTPGRQVLVEKGRFDLYAGETVLLLGLSGGGKTSIARLLGGLLTLDGTDWSVRGTLMSSGRHHDLSREQPNAAGLVFQGNALFDILNAGDNIAIAADHAPQPIDEEISRLLAVLLMGIDLQRPVSALSGGQRQRIAIARTVAAQRQVLILDEPNSGLDSLAAQRLVDVLKTLSRSLRVPIIIIAHHYDELLSIADKVLVLCPDRRLLQVPPDQIEQIEGALYGDASPPQNNTPQPPDHAVAVCESGGRPRPTPQADQPVSEQSLNSPLHKPRSRLYWQLNFALRAAWGLIASPLVIAYVLSGAGIIGFITLWFGFNYDVLGPQVRSFVHDDALKGIGFIIINTATPLIVCLLLVARNSALISAQIGSMRYSDQLSAFHNLRIPGLHYILVGMLLSMSFGALALMTLALLVASWAAFQSWEILFPGQPIELWRQHYLRMFVDNSGRLSETLHWIVVKTLLSTTMATLLAFRLGLHEQRSLLDINTIITRAVVLGVLSTMFVHAGLTIWQL